MLRNVARSGPAGRIAVARGGPLGVAKRLLLASLAGGLLLAGCGPTPSPASPEVYQRPADGVFTLTGHGWGHGHGMSQWGAQGAASQGRSAEDILSIYYPGTARTVQANSDIRVLLTADDSVDEWVLPVAGLTVGDGANRRLTVPAGARGWRVLADSAGLHLQRLDAGWTTVAVAGATALSSPVRLTSGTGIVSVVLPDGSSRDYRGAAVAVRRGTTGLYSTVAVPMESYLRSVVPTEMSPSWLPAALQAQAVAARTYAAQRRASAPYGAAYDICDSTSCQVFSGTARRSPSGAVTYYEYAASDAAIALTAGQIRTWAGAPAFTEFGASNGGWSVAGGQPYLAANADPWDGAVPNSVHTWQARLPASLLEARFPAVGRLLRIAVTGRDGNGEWGGRVTTVVLEGVDGAGRATSVATTGAGVVGAKPWPGWSDGLRSTWWHIDGAATASSVPGAPAVPSTAPAFRATVDSLAAAPSLAPGNPTGEVRARFRNAGTRTWTLSALRLSPVTTADATLSARTSVMPARDLSRGGDVVQPGDVVEVRTPLDGSTAGTGTYLLAYRLTAPGFVLSDPVRWMVGVRGATHTGTPALVAAVLGMDPAPDLVRPSATGEVSARFRNAGSASWSLSAIRLNPAGLEDVVLVAAGAAPTARNLSRSGDTVQPGDVVAVRLRLDGGRQPIGVTRRSFRLIAPGFLLSDPVSWPISIR